MGSDHDSLITARVDHDSLITAFVEFLLTVAPGATPSNTSGDSDAEAGEALLLDLTGNGNPMDSASLDLVHEAEFICEGLVGAWGENAISFPLMEIVNADEASLVLERLIQFPTWRQRLLIPLYKSTRGAEPLLGHAVSLCVSRAGSDADMKEITPIATLFFPAFQAVSSFSVAKGIATILSKMQDIAAQPERKSRVHSLSLAKHTLRAVDQTKAALWSIFNGTEVQYVYLVAHLQDVARHLKNGSGACSAFLQDNFVDPLVDWLCSGGNEWRGLNASHWTCGMLNTVAETPSLELCSRSFWTHFGAGSIEWRRWTRTVRWRSRGQRGAENSPFAILADIWFDRSRFLILGDQEKFAKFCRGMVDSCTFAADHRDVMLCLIFGLFASSGDLENLAARAIAVAVECSHESLLAAKKAFQAVSQGDTLSGELFIASGPAASFFVVATCAEVLKTLRDLWLDADGCGVTVGSETMSFVSRLVVAVFDVVVRAPYLGDIALVLCEHIVRDVLPYVDEGEDLVTDEENISGVVRLHLLIGECYSRIVLSASSLEPSACVREIVVIAVSRAMKLMLGRGSVFGVEIRSKSGLCARAWRYLKKKMKRANFSVVGIDKELGELWQQLLLQA